MQACTLQTPRITLRAFSPEDAAVLYALSQEETLKRHLPDQVYDTVEEAAEVAAFLMDKASKGQWPFVLGVVIRETGELIGHVGLSPVENGIEIGYSIAMAHQGKAYATEVVAAFSKWGAEHIDLSGIWAIVRADNEASIKVLKKAGYVWAWEDRKKAFGGWQLCCGYLFGQGVVA